MKPATFAAIWCTASVLLWESPELPAGDGVMLEHPSNFATPGDKMRNIVMPLAPVLGERLHPLDVLRWLGNQSRVLDPDGEGITFIVQVPDERPPESPDTMAQWRAPAGGGIKQPEVENVRLGDYLGDLCTVCGWTFEVTEEAIIVRPARKGARTRNPEQPATPQPTSRK